MKRVKRSLMSVLLIASMVFSSIAYGAIARADAGDVGGSADGQVLYEEDFDGETITTLQQAGWQFNGSDAGNITYEMNSDALRARTGDAYYDNGDAYNWTYYTYESQMTIATKYPDGIPGNLSKTTYVGLRFGVDKTTKMGLEYAIHYNPDNSSYSYRVWDRNAGTAAIEETLLENADLALDKEMTLKVKVEGTTFTIYLDGVELASATMAEPITGTIGTLGNTSTVFADFDNMRVTKNPDVLYDENFNNATLESLRQAGWVLPYDTANSREFFSVEDGVLCNIGGNAHYGNAEAYTWTDYTYESQMTFETKQAFDGENVNEYLGIQFGVDSNGNGLEYAIHYQYDAATDTSSYSYRVWDRNAGSAVIADTEQTALTDKGLAENQPMTLKVKVEGSIFTIYLNGEELASHTMEAPITGTIGTRRSGNQVNQYFDNILVTKNPQDTPEDDPGDGEEAGEDINVNALYAENFDETAIETLQAAGWVFPTRNDGRPYYEINETALRGIAGNAYYNNEEAYQWTDYTYESKMTIATKYPDGIPDNLNKATYVGLRFGVDETTKEGLEYAIRYDHDSGNFYYRVLERSTVKPVIAETLLENTDLALDLDKEMTLKVKVEGKTFTIYLNGEELASAAMAEPITGTIGTLGNTTTVYFDFDDMLVTKNPWNVVDESEEGDGEDDDEVDENALYAENFNNATISSLQADGWIFHLRDNGTPYYEMNGTALRGITGNAYYNNAAAYQWTDYTYESKMTIATKYDDGRAEEGWLGLRFGVDSSGNGLEYAIHYVYNPETGYSYSYRVYDRNTRNFVVPEAPLTNANLAKDQEMTLKVKVEGRIFTIYLNDEELGGGIMPEPITGTIGTLMNSTTVYLDFDDMLVTQNPATGEEEEGNITFLVDENFDEYNNGDTPVRFSNGWRTTNNDAVVRDGKLLLNTSANLYARENFTNGYVSADILLEDVSDVFAQAEEDTTVYPVSLTARNTLNSDMHEFRTRIALTKGADGEYTAQMQVVVYSRTDYEGPQVYSYPITDFAFGKTYNLKIICVGNYFAVAMDDILLFERACATTHGLYERQGIFGILTAENTANVLLDNVQIVKYAPRQITVHEDCAEEVSVYSYPDLIAGSKESYQRTAYYVGEHVKIWVSPKEGYVLDTNSLKYITASGETRIVDHASNVLYGFFMPAADVVVYAAFVPGSGPVNDIFFTENFDGDNSMLDNGWNANGNIINGRLLLGGSLSSVYLTDLLGADSWSDYTVQAEVSLSDADLNYNIGVAAVCVRTSGTGNGYEFGIQMGTSARTGIFRLYDRTTRTVLAQGNGGLTVERDKTYQLKVVVQGNRIICFVDGVCIFDVVDSANSNPVGTIGLRTNAGNGYYDNIVVRKIDPEELNASSTGAGTATVPKTGDTTEPGWLWLLAGLSFTGALCLGYLGRRRYVCYVKRKI